MKKEKSMDYTREEAGLERMLIPETILIPIEEYKELLVYKGKYEELRSICDNKLTSPIIRNDNSITTPWVNNIRYKGTDTLSSEELPTYNHNECFRSAAYGEEKSEDRA